MKGGSISFILLCLFPARKANLKSGFYLYIFYFEILVIMYWLQQKNQMFVRVSIEQNEVKKNAATYKRITLVIVVIR